MRDARSGGRRPPPPAPPPLRGRGETRVALVRQGTPLPRQRGRGRGRGPTRRTAVLLAAILLDVVAAEPPAAVHPVVWIGRTIRALERRAPRHGETTQFVYGVAASTLVVGATGIAAGAVMRAPLPPSLRLVSEVWLLKTTFAVRALLAAAEAVRRPLAHGALPDARAALQALVSRETADLTPELVAAAAIESLAENLTDSALAPWLAYAGGGLPAAAAYRALNTLDSMVGYRGRYEHLGKFAARGDDLVNLLPARLGALLIALAAPLGGGSARRAWLTAIRHHGRTASPNAGWTMAAMAGALGVRLEKTGAYVLGDGPAPDAADIRRAERIVGGALALGAAIAAALTYITAKR